MTLGLGTLALTLGVLALGAGSAEAYRGDATVLGPSHSAERHQAMENAFAQNNYAAWKELMGDRGRVTELVTAANFQQFAKAHDLAQAGKVQEAQQIRQSLGLGGGQRHGAGDGTGNQSRQANQHAYQRAAN